MYQVNQIKKARMIGQLFCFLVHPTVKPFLLEMILFSALQVTNTEDLYEQLLDRLYCCRQEHNELIYFLFYLPVTNLLH